MKPVHVLRWYSFAYVRRHEFKIIISIACVMQHIIFWYDKWQGGVNGRMLEIMETRWKIGYHIIDSNRFTIYYVNNIIRILWLFSLAQWISLIYEIGNIVISVAIFGNNWWYAFTVCKMWDCSIFKLREELYVFVHLHISMRNNNPLNAYRA